MRVDASPLGSSSGRLAQKVRRCVELLQAITDPVDGRPRRDRSGGALSPSTHGRCLSSYFAVGGQIHPDDVPSLTTNRHVTYIWWCLPALVTL